MEKKNTVLLTVIAIATLLVAVVGATFAYFTATNSSDAKTNVSVSTAKAADTFSTESTGNIAIEKITAADMAIANVGEVFTSDDQTITVSLDAGDGTAECTYDLVWNWAEDSDAYSATEGLATVNDGKEFTLSATFDGATQQLAETNLDTITNGTVIGKATISNTDPAEKTSQIWTISSKFYNVNLAQEVKQAGKSYAGTVSIGSVKCTNGGQVTYEK